MSIAALAERFGVHLNTVRFHLEALTRSGRVERVDATPTGPGRPPLLFRALDGMDPAGPRSYQFLAAVLATGLADGPEGSARLTEAGRAWGARLVEAAQASQTPEAAETPESTENHADRQAIERLTAVLTDVGFAPAPVPPSDPDRIDLRHCPFLELATTSPQLTCPVHLGLMRGVLEALGASVGVERLDPFVEPDRCVASLSRSATPVA